MRSIPPRTGRLANVNPDGKSDKPQGSTGRKRTRMVRPYPVHTLEDALTVAVAIQESNSSLPFDRVLLARAMGTTPASSGFTMKLNSSAKYGLTQGAYNDDRISLTPLGEAIVAPKGGDERHRALVETATRPEVFGRFYRMLAGKRLPEDEYAQNVLKRELSVHPDLAAECLGIIKANGEYVHILVGDQGDQSVTLERRQEPDSAPRGHVSETPSSQLATSSPEPRVGDESIHGGRIFIGHSAGAQAALLVARVLDDFGIPYGTGQAGADDSQPLSADVSEEMRRCTAAVLIFALGDARRQEGRKGMSPRMLYQLGAASALYRDRILVLAEPGIELDNKLVGVRTVVFDTDTPHESTLALLRGLHWAGVIKVTV